MVLKWAKESRQKRRGREELEKATINQALLDYCELKLSLYLPNHAIFLKARVVASLTLKPFQSVVAQLKLSVQSNWDILTIVKLLPLVHSHNACCVFWSRDPREITSNCLLACLLASRLHLLAVQPLDNRTAFKLSSILIPRSKTQHLWDKGLALKVICIRLCLSIEKSNNFVLF